MNILYFSNYASMSRGGQRSLWYLLRELDRERYRPLLVCQESGELTALADKAGIPTVVAPMPRLRPAEAPAIMRALRLFRRLIREHEIDVIHSEEFVVVLLAALLKPFTKVKIIWHVRVLWDHRLQELLATLVCDRIVCVSEAVRAAFPRSDNLVTDENGVDPDEFRPMRQRTVSSGELDEAKAVVGYLGRLAENKGTPVLVRAAAAVLRRRPGVKFLLVGAADEGYRDLMSDQAARLGVSESVVFWGEERERTAELLNRMDVFTLPSLLEGLSRSLLEAMACGRPVVASDLPQNAEVVIPGKTGLLARAGDPDDLAEKILKLLDEPELGRALGENARKLVIEKYTVRRTAEKIQRIYEELSEKRR